MKKYLVAAFAAITLALAAAPSAFALHSVEWAAGQACAGTYSYAIAAGVSPYANCGWLSPQSGWNLPGHPNRFYVVVSHNRGGGYCHPAALRMGVEVTDGGAVTTNFNTWSWDYWC